MKKKSLLAIIISLLLLNFSFGQDYGDFPIITPEQALNDLEILHQGLDKFHSGMYWYTPKDSVDNAFKEVKKKINKDLSIPEYYKLIAPLVALSREGHTNISLPENIKKTIIDKASFLPITIVFLKEQLYCILDGSNLENIVLEGKEIESINGEKPIEIAKKLAGFLTADGYIKTSKFTDLSNFSLSLYYFYYYGNVKNFTLKFKEIEKPILIDSLQLAEIRKNVKNKQAIKERKAKKDLLEFKIITSETAYLGVHSFSNPDIKEGSKEKNIENFLVNSFESIATNKIKNIIIDVSENSGGTEGNESLLYSYLGENYQKYKTVRAKTQNAILDNGVDKPIELKTFGFLERTFVNKKMKDGSFERREWIGYGLKAFKKKPKNAFSGKVYVIISPLTYSGGSEFSNMVYTNDLATFVGEETGGGYYGNTSGYTQELILPNSKIEVNIPALQFVMNVAPKLPFGRGVIPHHEIIPTFEQYVNEENPSLDFILKSIEKDK
ncbi:S41 family peptidase [Flavobacterium ardleyense]|uniref:S41 family peptidase n=1 Tax=Flavobacterium ardleyense TaxID=2038737 RepID=A0ABW5Z8Z4_9FLAO